MENDGRDPCIRPHRVLLTTADRPQFTMVISTSRRPHFDEDSHDLIPNSLVLQLSSRFSSEPRKSSRLPRPWARGSTGANLPSQSRHVRQLLSRSALSAGSVGADKRERTDKQKDHSSATPRPTVNRERTDCGSDRNRDLVDSRFCTRDKVEIACCGQFPALWNPAAAVVHSDPTLTRVNLPPPFPPEHLLRDHERCVCRKMHHPGNWETMSPDCQTTALYVVGYIPP
ncbi:hypothetical protein B0T19DRAFT_227420 [Cercophora scortea]|uniref:Uncharacterized protein n=1 Tax=Cercophora scortea TaxID=314031 RepID=A0AAE0M9V3_9PEZI|nr:hypothetical protein B0T19DRAFT_227420 [Cercophora scortea]